MFLDGAKTWDSLKGDSKNDLTLLGKKEKVYSKTSQVWTENETHLKMYKGTLYNVISDSDKNYVAVNQVNDKQALTKGGLTVRKSGETAPKKKGVRGFFNKVFGKKDKK